MKVEINERNQVAKKHGLDPDMVSAMFEIAFDPMLGENIAVRLDPYTGAVGKPYTYSEIKKMFPKFADKLIWMFAFTDDEMDLSYADVVIMKTGEIFIYNERGDMVKMFNDFKDSKEINMRQYTIPKETELKLEDKTVVLEQGDKIVIHEGYNGYTNYTTWVVNLWLDNDGTINYYGEMVQEDPRLDERRLADLIQSYLEDSVGDLTKGKASLWADILNNALSEINFTEIAENIIESYR